MGKRKGRIKDKWTKECWERKRQGTAPRCKVCTYRLKCMIRPEFAKFRLEMTEDGKIANLNGVSFPIEDCVTKRYVDETQTSSR